MIRFIVVIAALSAALLVSSRMLVDTPPSWDIPIVAFLAVTTIAVYLLLQKPRKGDPEKFTRLYLLSITAKIVVACAFVITFVLVDKQGSEGNSVLFLTGYVIFTAVEVGFLILAPRR